MTGRFLVLTLVLASVQAAIAQQPAPAPAATALPQRFAPIDLTGTWVSIVTEDWAVRMITPPKGDFESLPLTRAAQDTANRFDLTQAETGGRACEAYGAPALLRIPGRIRVSWQDANTLKVESDAGEQTRLLHFDAAASSAGSPSRQGFSTAQWQYANGFDPIRAAAATAIPAPGPGGGRGGAAAGGRAGGGGGGLRGRGPAVMPSGGKLKVTTTGLTPGLLRKNGIPYSGNTQLTEYFNLLTEPSGTQWIVVTTVVHDPENLVVDYITSTNFRKEPDNSKWRPQPCTLK